MGIQGLKWIKMQIKIQEIVVNLFLKSCSERLQFFSLRKKYFPTVYDQNYTCKIKS